MAESQLQTLLSTKAALDLGLISQADFDSVKAAFIRSQQIKAALDTGLIKAEDYESVKREFLNSLQPGGVSAAAAPAAPAVPQSYHRTASTPSLTASGPQQQPYQQPQQQTAAPAVQQQPQQQPQQARPTPAPAVHRPPPPAAAPGAEPPAQAVPAASGDAAPGLARSGGSSGSGGTAPVPSNIPKMGGIKPKNGGTSMSGISITEDAVNLFYLMKAKSTYRWALWQIDESGSSVVIAAVGSKDASYGDFLTALPDSDCRYGVFDYRYTNNDGQAITKLVFLNWAPDAARVKSKMMYASTKDFFKSHLDGISAEFQASDLDEISEEEVSAAVKALKR
ncbi:hypothetical protein N2152v2_008421 [Parachlorella kessleri]